MQLHDHDSVKPEWKHLWKHRENTLKPRSTKQLDTLSERCHQMDQLLVGDTCRVQNQTGRYPRRWDKLGTVIESADNDQYIIRIHGSNRVTLRNRKFLRRVNHEEGRDIRRYPTSATRPEVNDAPNPRTNSPNPRTNSPSTNVETTTAVAPTRTRSTNKVFLTFSLQYSSAGGGGGGGGCLSVTFSYMYSNNLYVYILVLSVQTFY